MNETPRPQIPARRFIAPDIDPPADEFGFLADRFIPSTLTVGELLTPPATLVVSAPWTGKTFVAKQLELYFTTKEVQEEVINPYGRFFHATLFESRLAVDVPRWWEKWLTSTKNALWIIDAVDEDVRRGGDAIYRILGRLEDLQPQDRNRLRVVIFTRESEEPSEVRDKLRELYPNGGSREPTGLQVVRLAPLSSLDARELLGGDPGRFDRVCQIITRNQLQDIAWYPAVLGALGAEAVDVKLSRQEIWRKVLRRLLIDEKTDDGRSLSVLSVDDRFRAVSRIAMALTLSGHEEVSFEQAGDSTPTLSDIIPRDLQHCEPLRKAATLACNTAVFQRTVTGYRFCQQHVQEWFAAFGLSDLTAKRIRPLMADTEDKPLLRCVGVLRLLHPITSLDDVRDWITELFGGVPPCSDAAPSLVQSIVALDRLQELARQTRFGLSLWKERGLGNLAAPGLGTEVARRLADKSLSFGERRLMIEVAHATNAAEVADAATSLVKDEEEPGQLRVSAAMLLHQIGTDEQFRELEHIVVGGAPSTGAERDLVAVIIRELLTREIWSFAKAAKYAPSASAEIVDMTTMLEYKLKESMTLADARELVLTADWEQIASDRGERATSRSRGPYSVLIEAVELLAKQDSLTHDDYQVLRPIILSKGRLIERVPILHKLPGVFSRDKTARRGLFVSGIEADSPEGGYEGWRWVLTGDDVEWLEELVHQQPDPSKWLLKHLLGMTYHEGVSAPVRTRIREFVAEVDPELVAEFERRREHVLEQQRRIEEEERQRQEEEAAQQIPVTKAVEDILQSPDRPLQHRLWQLASVSLTDEFARPRNVAGSWEDLTPELQTGVLNTCEEALHTCKSTPIPEGGSYPGAIIYESCAFRKVVHTSESYRLDGEQIKRWLQSTLIFSIPDYDAILKNCMAADPVATQDVLLQEIRRTLSSELETSHVASSLPVEYWSERLVAGALQLVRDESLNLKGRCDLARLIAPHAPDGACTLAQSWIEADGDSPESRKAKCAVAIDVLLVVDARRALSELANWDEVQARELLLELRLLWGRGEKSPVRLNEWPSVRLEQLAGILHAHFPADTDPQPEGAHFISPEDGLRELRRQLHVMLFNRGTLDDRAALDRLATKYAEVTAWLQHADANRAVSQVLHPHTIPVVKVIRLLDDALYRLIRSPEDLQRVLLDELAEIQNSVKEHLSSLYMPLNRNDPDLREHLHEDALQTYLYCRLNDRLPGRVLEPETAAYFINRESLGTKNQRLDLKIEAPTISGGKATVVIEVKWVSNAEVGTSLKTQLGEEYLHGVGLKHGIYLVGWACTTRRGIKALGIPARLKYSIPTWMKALRTQAKEVQSTHPNVRIEPFIMDLQWDRRRSGHNRE